MNRLEIKNYIKSRMSALQHCATEQERDIRRDELLNLAACAGVKTKDIDG